MKYFFLLVTLVSFVFFGYHFRSVTKEINSVNVKDFGAKGDGINDDSNALQAATNTGKIVIFDSGKYLLAKTIKYTGKVQWKGKGKSTIIISDSVVIIVKNGSGSTLQSLLFNNKTNPVIVRRDWNNPAKKPTISVAVGNGYQPTINDGDVYGTLSQSNQKQDVGPSVVFRGDATGITIDRIYGNMVSILINDAQKSIVSNCSFRGGKNTFGGIVFSNLNKRGIGNEALNNHIKSASYCGIVFIGNSNGVIKGNTCEYNGESGIKLYQNDIGKANARCYRMLIESNICQYNYYDGFDLQADYPRNGLAQTFNYVYNNKAQHNFKTGYIVDGVGLNFIKNYAGNNWGSGVNAFNNKSLFSDNTFDNNNLSNEVQGVHQFVLTDGDNNIISGNKFLVDKVTQGYTIYDATGNNILKDNAAKIETIFVGKK